MPSRPSTTPGQLPRPGAASPSAALIQLARQHSILTSYLDAHQQRQPASPETLQAVLHAMGVEWDAPADTANALRAARQQQCRTILEPVTVAWANTPATVTWTLPEPAAHQTLAARLRLESGAVLDLTQSCRKSAEVRTAKVEGTRYVTRRLRLPPGLPWGYHRLELETSSGREQTMVIVAPQQAYTPPDAPRRWGLFLPLYALHSQNSWGAGHFGDLEKLCHWTARQGGQIVSTLPLLAAFLDEPFEPSPYSPVSRLFWNELFLNLEQVPEISRCGPAQRRLRSRQLRRQRDALRRMNLVDYRRQMALQRPVLEMAARGFFSETSTSRRRAFDRFVQGHPFLEDYARFRAVMERRRCAWAQWPARLRSGCLRPSDHSQSAFRYHLFVQWLAHEQVTRLSKLATRRNLQLYLDMPLGVNPNGFDVWRQQDLFALQASGGAPPDPFFTKGQDWGFPPLHPERMRQAQYAYLLDYLRHQLRHTRMLRFDHVMSLRRLYWVPRGFPPSQGAYVQYPFEEYAALLCLESHRHQAVIVGENLGTVPPEVNAGLRQHHIRQMYVAQYEMQPPPRRTLRPIPRHCVASLNTHDMPPFQAYWHGLDIVDRAELGLLSPPMSQQEKRRRRTLNQALIQFLRRHGRLRQARPGEGALLEALLAHLAASSAETVLLNLEDLWAETTPQNVPGTSTQRVNWRRKTRLTLDQIIHSPTLNAVLNRIHRLRKETP